MAKPKLWVAHLERGETKQRMQFAAADKADAKDFAEREALREAEWACTRDENGELKPVGDEAELRKQIREAAFKVVKVEQA